MLVAQYKMFYDNISYFKYLQARPLSKMYKLKKVLHKYSRYKRVELISSSSNCRNYNASV